MSMPLLIHLAACLQIRYSLILIRDKIYDQYIDCATSNPRGDVSEVGSTIQVELS